MAMCSTHTQHALCLSCSGRGAEKRTFKEKLHEAILQAEDAELQAMKEAQKQVGACTLLSIRPFGSVCTDAHACLHSKRTHMQCVSPSLHANARDGHLCAMWWMCESVMLMIGLTSCAHGAHLYQRGLGSHAQTDVYSHANARANTHARTRTCTRTSACAHSSSTNAHSSNTQDKKSLAISLLVEGKPRAFVDFFQLTHPAAGQKGQKLSGVSLPEAAGVPADLPPQSLMLLKDQLVSVNALWQCYCL